MALAGGGADALTSLVAVAGAAATAGQVTVAFVLDFGSTGNELVGCVKVPKSDNGYQALSAFVAQEKLAAPTFAPSGLLCSIGAIPASGCGVEVNGHYAYWSYFSGSSGHWVYATTGAFAQVAPTGDVEGWRFQPEGSGNPKDPAPITTPSSAVSCPTTTPTTTTTAPSTTTTVPATTTTVAGELPGGATGGSSGSGPAAEGAATPPTSAAPPTTSALAFTPSPTTTAPGSTTTAPRTVPGGNSLSVTNHSTTPAALAATPRPGVVPLLVVGTVLLGLAGAGIVLRRRRPPTS